MDKIVTTICFDVVRHALILSATFYVLLLAWRFHWIVALIAALPVYVVMLNVIGLLTLPLYALTPEARMARKELRAIMSPYREKPEVTVSKETAPDA
jgi:hypothetical protein